MPRFFALRFLVQTLCGVAWCLSIAGYLRAEAPVDFNRDIRSVISNTCFRCHGPDEAERQADLRLDTRDGALADLGGHAALVPGKPDESEILARITSTDPEVMMPPPGAGKRLGPHEVELFRRWIAEGANYQVHWAYQHPKKVVPPEREEGTGTIAQPTTEIDRFVKAKLGEHRLAPSEEADRATLIRRVSLDLTGLPPTEAEVAAYLADTQDGAAYERLVDRLLAKPTFGEHWAHMWLDLARYADSSGYADDPMRTIWGYRDYVIRSLNANKPFDQFTIEQLAGDLLPNPTEEQLVATAFHRNTLTNNEGGTNNEEFRNVAVVDRVNTTFAVWMATTISCAQCHTHKYDPITQKEFFEVFAILNNTADADLGDDSPRLDLFSEEQKANRTKWQAELAALDVELSTSTPALQESLAQWDRDYPRDLPWTALKPAAVTSQNGAEYTISEDQSVLVAKPPKTDVTTLSLPVAAGPLSALRLEALTDPTLPANGPGHAGGNFVISRVSAVIVPEGETRPQGRYLRVESPGPGKFLHLAEVQVFNGADNVAVKGKATQSSIGYGGDPERGIDGNTNGNYYEANSVFHTADGQDNPWWEVDLQALTPVDKVVIWNRTDGGVEDRFANSKIALLDESRKPVWEQAVAEGPKPNAEYAASAAQGLKFTTAVADFSQDAFPAESVLTAKTEPSKGWAIGGKQGEPHWLVLFPESATEIPAHSQIQLVIEQTSQHESHVPGKFRVSVSSSPRAIEVARTPTRVRELLAIATEARTPEQATELAAWYFVNAAPELAAQRAQRAKTHADLLSLKAETSVPVFRELAGEARRKTRLQHRGTYTDLGDEVPEGIPAAFIPQGSEIPRDRLALAKWIVSRDNPLTARVMVNRLWEALFGQGIVLTSEDFGTQGELPTHPELLDALAVDFMDSGWNMKQMLKQIATSATYRQSSKVTPDRLEADPDNRWLSRGPRFRMSAEMIRDQSLALSGLLSPKMYGPPVRPPQPKLGLTAAFGSSTDWETSAGEDRYRRALYTQFRRSNPYPSMAAFDAPNREVCTVRRIRTNTPLQALVTLNDPVHLEAAQNLARQVVTWDGSLADRAARLFRHCTARDPHPEELARLAQLHETVRTRAAADPASASLLASDPLGPIPEGLDPVDLAAWTVVGNVILNLDEMLMKR